MTPRQFWAVAAGGGVLACALGLLALPFVFFVACAFADSVEPARHVVFLGGVVAAAVVTGTLASNALLDVAPDRRLVRGVARQSVAAAYGVALAVGVLVSMAHEDQNSVTADQPDAPFVALVALCFAVAAAAVAWLVRTYRRDVVSRA